MKGVTRAWLTIAFIAISIGSLNIWMVRQQSASTLAIEMKSSVPARAKVFFDTGQGFSDAESSEQWVLGGPEAHTLHFPFPARAVQEVRFDPLDTDGEVEVRSIKLERPENHQLVRTFDLRTVSPLFQIASSSVENNTLRVATLEEANDAQLLLSFDKPVTVDYATEQFFSKRILWTDAFTVLLAATAFAAVRYRRRWWRFLAPSLAATNEFFTATSRRLTRPGIYEVDRTALWCYSLCLVAFVSFSLAKLHGSSISMAGSSFRGWMDVTHTPLLGNPKQVRSDEWGFHTPAILNQVFRPHKLAVTDSTVGPGKAALLGNLPCWHFTQLFRPQFWPFFILPVDYAFAFYWQAKAFLLLTGVFTVLLLMTRSSPVAALGALWYFFSAFTQWAYSWASLLPEMVGLFCWVISLTCYLLVGRNRIRLIVAAVCCISAAINFALSCYPPHQVPLVAFGVLIMTWWFWARRNAIWRRDFLVTRVLVILGCGAIIGGVMIWFYLDGKETLIAAANTIYPGHRSSGGGGVPIVQFVSHFLDFWKSETHFPPSQGNISEASGYLWLAPVTLLMMRKGGVRESSLIICLWVAFILILSWMLFPIPAAIGRWVFFDKVPPFRCYHALGLINIAIVSVFLAQRPQPEAWKPFVANPWILFPAIVTVSLVLFSAVNVKLDRFFSTWAIGFASVYAALLIFFLLRHRIRAFSLALIVPLVFANGLINPVDRGLAVITESSLFKAVHAEGTNLQIGKWIVYAPWADEPGMFAATGIEVLDTLKIIPERSRLAPFDPDHRYQEIVNRSCYLIAMPLGPSESSSFETVGPANVLWRVHPLDPRLKDIGVEHVAFAHQQLTAPLRRQFAPYLEQSLPGLNVYRRP